MKSLTRFYRYALLPAPPHRGAAAPFTMKSAFKEYGQGTPGKEQK
jgi:hypothetical protein